MLACRSRGAIPGGAPTWRHLDHQSHRVPGVRRTGCANLPFVPNPEAKIVFDDGELDVRIDTDLPVIGWFIKGQSRAPIRRKSAGGD